MKKHNQCCVDNLTIENIESIKEELKNGEYQKDIMKKYNITRYYLRKIIREEEIPVTEENMKSDEGNKKNIREIVISQTDQAKIPLFTWKLNVIANEEENKKKFSKELSDEIIEKIRADLDKRLRINYISKKYGVTAYRVKKIRDEEITVS